MSILFNRKCCATCNYWGGPREIVSGNKSVRCEKESVAGLCTSPKSSFKKKQTKSGYGGCSHYEKWMALT